MRHDCSPGREGLMKRLNKMGYGKCWYQQLWDKPTDNKSRYLALNLTFNFLDLFLANSIKPQYLISGGIL